MAAKSSAKLTRIATAFLASVAHYKDEIAPDMLKESPATHAYLSGITVMLAVLVAAGISEANASLLLQEVRRHLDSSDPDQMNLLVVVSQIEATLANQ